MKSTFNLKFYYSKLYYDENLNLKNSLESADWKSKLISSGEQLRILDKTLSEGHMMGIIGYSKSQNTPPKYNATQNKITALELNEEEGLFYGNVFLIDFNLKVLLYMKAVPGISDTAFVEYLGMICGSKIKKSIIVDEQKKKKAKDLKNYRTLEIGIANPVMMFEPEDLSFLKTFGILEGDGKYKIEIKIKASRKNTLAKSKAVQAIKKLLKLNSSEEKDKIELSKFNVIGKDEEDHNIAIDLFDQKMYIEVPFELNRQSVLLIKEFMYSKVLEAYKSKFQYLKKNLSIQ